jgi:hypothetical protein
MAVIKDHQNDVKEFNTDTKSFIENTISLKPDKRIDLCKVSMIKKSKR